MGFLGLDLCVYRDGGEMDGEIDREMDRVG